jgi:urate oxidase
MSYEIATQCYGKSAVRLTKVTRGDDRHEVDELEARIELEGDFDAAYTEGDNRSVVPTDTMKNVVYAFARTGDVVPIEAFAERLARHFVASYDAVARAVVTLEQKRWGRLEDDGLEAPAAFRALGAERLTCGVEMAGEGPPTIVSGIRGLELLKTADSAFAGFPRDRYTTLAETEDRLLGTSLTARWTYADLPASWDVAREAVQTALLRTFARHRSRSVQHTLYDMAGAALDACPQAVEITLAMPNQHRLLVDLARFGLDNPNQVFVATSEPFGDIVATVRRADA